MHKRPHDAERRAHIHRHPASCVYVCMASAGTDKQNHDHHHLQKAHQTNSVSCSPTAVQEIIKGEGSEVVVQRQRCTTFASAFRYSYRYSFCCSASRHYFLFSRLLSVMCVINYLSHFHSCCPHPVYRIHTQMGDNV